MQIKLKYILSEITSFEIEIKRYCINFIFFSNGAIKIIYCALSANSSKEQLIDSWHTPVEDW